MGRDEEMQLGFVDFPNFAQGFGYASGEAIFEAREFSKTRQVGFRQGCDTRVVTSGKLSGNSIFKFRVSVEHLKIEYYIFQRQGWVSGVLSPAFNKCVLLDKQTAKLRIKNALGGLSFVSLIFCRM